MVGEDGGAATAGDEGGMSVVAVVAAHGTETAISTIEEIEPPELDGEEEEEAGAVLAGSNRIGTATAHLRRRSLISRISSSNPQPGGS